MKTLSVKKMENVEGGKFWGKETSCLTVDNGAGTDLYGWKCTTGYVFWISTGTNCEAVASC